MSNPLAADSPDVLQAAWKNPKTAHAIYVDEQYGMMIIPDAMPVVPVGHVLVVARESSLENMDDVRKAQFALAGFIVREHIARVFGPERKPGLCIWGNAVETPHIHVFPRTQKGDGKTFFEGRPRATAEQLAETQQRLTSSHWAEEFRRRLGGTT